MFAYAALVGILFPQELSRNPVKLHNRNVWKLTIEKFFLCLGKEQGLGWGFFPHLEICVGLCKNPYY